MSYDLNIIPSTARWTPEMIYANIEAAEEDEQSRFGGDKDVLDRCAEDIARQLGEDSVTPFLACDPPDIEFGLISVHLQHGTEQLGASIVVGIAKYHGLCCFDCQTAEIFFPDGTGFAPLID